jgi:hypothetical protein
MAFGPFRLPCVALALPLALGCGSKEAVMASMKIESPSLTVDGTALTTELGGGFDLVLALGDYASDPTTVKLGTFTLQRDGDVLVDNLQIDTDPKFPITLGVGKSKRVAVTVMHSVMDPDAVTELCAAELAYVGALTDSLGDNRPTTVRSDRITPDCL